MRTDFRPQSSGFDKSEREHRHLLRVEMKDQLEMLGEQRLQHQPHLILRGIADGRLCVGGEIFRLNPSWYLRQPGLSLRRRQRKFVSKLDVVPQWKAGLEDASRGSVDVVDTQGKSSGIPLVTRMDSRGFKRHSAACGLLPLGLFGRLSVQQRQVLIRMTAPGDFFTYWKNFRSGICADLFART